VVTGIEFLQSLIDDELTDRGYSSVNTARAALSALLVLPEGGTFGEHPRVKTFMKGVANLNPVNPRYQEIWDTDVVLEMLKREEWVPAGRIPIRNLSLKLVTLILLSTGQRPQILKALNVDTMDVSGEKFSFKIKNSQLKQGRLGYKPDLLELKKFDTDKRICVYRYLTAYLKRTLDSRGKEKQLLLTWKKPCHAASQDTMSRWVKETLSLAGIDIKKFKAGSTRAAATSKAKACGGTLEEILRAGGWSQATTFSRWYDRPVRAQRRSLDDIIFK
jgi:hypothetical protein